jgi:hypothetical protein
MVRKLLYFLGREGRGFVRGSAGAVVSASRFRGHGQENRKGTAEKKRKEKTKRKSRSLGARDDKPHQRQMTKGKKEKAKCWQPEGCRYISKFKTGALHNFLRAAPVPVKTRSLAKGLEKS